jgi:hypothetical protein
MLRVIAISLDWFDCWAAPAVAFCDCVAALTGRGAAADKDAATAPIASIRNAFADISLVVLIVLSMTSEVIGKLFACR